MAEVSSRTHIRDYWCFQGVGYELGGREVVTARGCMSPRDGPDINEQPRLERVGGLSVAYSMVM